MINVCVNLFGFFCIVYLICSFKLFLFLNNFLKCGVFCGVEIIRIFLIFVNIRVDIG